MKEISKLSPKKYPKRIFHELGILKARSGAPDLVSTNGSHLSTLFIKNQLQSIPVILNIQIIPDKVLQSKHIKSLYSFSQLQSRASHVFDKFHSQNWISNLNFETR